MARRDDEELGIIYRLQHEQMEVLAILRDSQDKHTQILEMLRRRDADGSPHPEI